MQDDDDRPEMITGDGGQTRPVDDAHKTEAQRQADQLRAVYQKQNPGVKLPDAPKPAPAQEQTPPNDEQTAPMLPNGNDESEQGLHIRSVTLTVEPSNAAPATADINEGGLPGLPRQPARAGVSSELQAAYNYHAQGLPPIPIKRGAKQAAIDNWQSRSIPVEDFPQYWGGATPCGIAIPLGGRSKGLMDMDLDWAEARVLADELDFMFGSLLVFGRKGAPRSHRLAICKESLDLGECRTVAFTIPGAIAKRLGLSEEEHATNVLEVRGNNGYTIFPPSVHTSGERIEWDNAIGRSVPEMPYTELMSKAGLLAFGSCMIKFYPPVGMRNDFNLALGGTFLRALRDKYGEDEGLLIDHVDRLVTTICRLAGDTGRGPSWEKRAATTLAKIKAGTPVTGLPKILEILGIHELDKIFRKWLGVDDDDRAVINYHEADLAQMLEATQAIMLQSKLELFQRGGGLVHVYRLNQTETEDKIRRERDTLSIGEVGHNRLAAYFTTVVRFKEHRATPKPHYKEVLPSERFCKTFLSWVDGWKFRILRAVCETPTMRPDGSLATQPGYDAESGLYLDFNGMTFPAIPDNPTKEQALAALAKLKHILRGFPFVPDDVAVPARSSSRSAALAAMLCGAVRRILDAAPLLLIGAPTAGTGKTLLANLFAIIATGRKASSTTLGQTIEEMEKRFVSVLMRGDPYCVLDNITVPLDGDILCTALTESTIQARILGSNETRQLPTNIMWIATGNRIQVKGDMVRRCVKIEMDAEVEAPELRQFDFDVAQEALDNRADLVAAILTVLRAWQITPDRKAVLATYPKLGSFNQWSDMVRGALIWLGEPDPCGMRESIANDDPVSSNLAQLLVAWDECAALETGREYAPAQILAIANNADAYASFNNAWKNCIRSFNNQFALDQMTKYLGKNSGRIIGGRRIVRTVNKHTKVANYALEVMGQTHAPATEQVQHYPEATAVLL